MAALDLSGLSMAELQALQTAVANQYFVTESMAREEAEQRKERIRNAAGQLQTLLGAEDAQPGMGSIREVLAFGDEAIAENPGQAVVLILKGMEQLTATTLDLAKTIAEQ